MYFSVWTSVLTGSELLEQFFRHISVWTRLSGLGREYRVRTRLLNIGSTTYFSSFPHKIPTVLFWDPLSTFGTRTRAWPRTRPWMRTQSQKWTWKYQKTILNNIHRFDNLFIPCYTENINCPLLGPSVRRFGPVHQGGTCRYEWTEQIFR